MSGAEFGSFLSGLSQAVQTFQGGSTGSNPVGAQRKVQVKGDSEDPAMDVEGTLAVERWGPLASCCRILQHMLSVPEAAKRSGKNPETIRRWIREGRLRARKVGTQHIIEEDDLDHISGEDRLPVPKWWPRLTSSGAPIPDAVAIIRRQRSEH
jgi:excisionase family DNA binding protein